MKNDIDDRFALELGGQVYLAEIKEKDEAYKLYKEAVEEGKSAGSTFKIFSLFSSLH